MAAAKRDFIVGYATSGDPAIADFRLLLAVHDSARFARTMESVDRLASLTCLPII